MKRTSTVLGFPRMTELVTPAEIGQAEVIHYTVTPIESWMSARNQPPVFHCPVGTYAVLKINGKTVMSDTRMERLTNQRVVKKAKGNVLIAGLGLGMILHPIAAKSQVRSITVVEQSRDVIRLIKETVPRKVKIVPCNIFEWSENGSLYDTIYFDIWPDMSHRNRKEMETLRRRFARQLRPGGWMGCWSEDEL